MPAAVFASLAAIAGFSSCSDKGYSGEPESISIGMESTAVNSLIYVAENQGYFTDNGLDVNIKDDYSSGAAAVEGMLKGEVDLTTAAELAIVRQAFAKEKIRAIGSIDTFIHMNLIGRKDLGIEETSDLKGKKIGVPVKTAADFFLGRFLDLNNIGRNEVFIIDVQAPDAVDALVKGDVDAVVVWQPNVINLKKKLEDNASMWSVQNNQPIYCAVISRNTLIDERPDVINRLLKSLDQAQKFVVNNPDSAQKILKERFDYDDEYMEEIWPEHALTLSLDQSLILAMEDQARWMINNNLTQERTVPDFLDYLYEDGLRTVKPEAVNVIH